MTIRLLIIFIEHIQYVKSYLGLIDRKQKGEIFYVFDFILHQGFGRNI